MFHDNTITILTRQVRFSPPEAGDCVGYYTPFHMYNHKVDKYGFICHHIP